MSDYKDVTSRRKALLLLSELGHNEPLSDLEIIDIFCDEIRRLQVERDLDNDELKASLLGADNLE